MDLSVDTPDRRPGGPKFRTVTINDRHVGTRSNELKRPGGKGVDSSLQTWLGIVRNVEGQETQLIDGHDFVLQL